MMKMMMEKKRIDREDLERKRAPLVEAQEAMHLKQLKMREVQKHKNTIFRETIQVLFPEVSEVNIFIFVIECKKRRNLLHRRNIHSFFQKPPPKPTDCETLAAGLQEKEKSFMRDYKDLEAAILPKLRKPAIVSDFNWKHVVQVRVRPLRSIHP